MSLCYDYDVIHYKVYVPVVTLIFPWSICHFQMITNSPRDSAVMDGVATTHDNYQYNLSQIQR